MTYNEFKELEKLCDMAGLSQEEKEQYIDSDRSQTPEEYAGTLYRNKERSVEDYAKLMKEDDPKEETPRGAVDILND